MTVHRVNFYIYDDLNRCFDRFSIESSNVDDKGECGSRELDTVDKTSKFNVTLKVDGYFLSVFFNILSSSGIYRRLVKKNLLKSLENIPPDGNIDVRFQLMQPKAEMLDYKWNNRISQMVGEKQRLESSMSWLSTLGGAFSALGDNFENCAIVAGKISLHQFKIALKLGDPPLVARCKLYMALSLIQQKKLKVAKKLIEEQYEVGKLFNDFRLLNMCKGIWAKLRYTYVLEHLKKKPLIV